MATKYTMVQYFPDPDADERINFGVIAFDERNVRAKFVSNWNRVRRFAGEDIDFLQDFAQRFAEAATSELLLPGIQQTNVLDARRLGDMIGSWHYGIQFCRPRASLESPDEIILELANRFLSEPSRKTRGFRDRNAAAWLAVQGVRAALSQRLGISVAQVLKPRHGLQGQLDTHRFDVVVGDGIPYFAAQGLSFEVPDTKALNTAIDVTAWAVDDVKRRDRTLPLGILALPPRTTRGELYARALEMYSRAARIFNGLGAAVLQEDQVEGWAAPIVDKLPLSE
jgi:hypothetical protein